MTQDSSQQAYKRLQDRPKTAPRGHGASQGGPREAKILQKPKDKQCFLPSRLFASDGLLRPQDAPKMTQESPKTGPKEAQDGPKSALRAVQEGPKRRLFGPRRGGREKDPPQKKTLIFLRCLKVFGLSGAFWAKVAPRGPKRAEDDFQDRSR